MQMRTSSPSRRPPPRDEGGFTMVVTIAILLITSLLIASALANASGDVRLTRSNTAAQQAYYAAQAGLQVYEFNLNTTLNYWQKCPRTEPEGNPEKKVSLLEETKETGDEESYKYETLPATGYTKCEENKQTTIVETSGTAHGTFRIKSTGYSNGVERSIVASFNHPGFLNYVFLSNYEVEDPSTFAKPPIHCEHYYNERKKHEEEVKTEKWLKECPPIPFIATDELKGPFHTNDAVALCSYLGQQPSFGRNSSDKIEMNEGKYADSLDEGCGGSFTMKGTYKTNGATLTPPTTDTELLETAEKKYEGRTIIELIGSTKPNTMKVTTENTSTKKVETHTVNFPGNGVIYVSNKSSPTCSLSYSPFSYDEDYEKDTDCGDVYVKGTYSESLTIAAQKDVIVTGNVTTTGEKGGYNEKTKPTGEATLGLIGENFVRVYHPVAASGKKKNNSETCEGTNQTESSTTTTKELGGSNANIVIDAAILSTKNSFIVDNFTCGASLGELIVWGAIAQNWRGRVTGGASFFGTTSGGYPEKNYNYDERLATKQPPNFLSPNSSGGWELERETAPGAGGT